MPVVALHTEVAKLFLWSHVYTWGFIYMVKVHWRPNSSLSLLITFERQAINMSWNRTNILFMGITQQNKYLTSIDWLNENVQSMACFHPRLGVIK